MTRTRKLTGPPARYRGKLRSRPLSITLTPEGHAALALVCTHRKLSRSDAIEELLRKAAAQMATPVAASA